MQSTLRAIILQGGGQPDADGGGTTQTRRQLVVQEDMIMNNSRYSEFTDALTPHASVQHDDQRQAIADYLNTSLTTAERRLGGQLEEALSASHCQFECAIMEHTDRRTSEIEARLQERLHAAQGGLEAAVKLAIDQHSFNIEAQISRSVGRTEAAIYDHVNRLHEEYEQRCQTALEERDFIAEISTTVQVEQQVASIEQRLQMLLNTTLDNHTATIGTQLQEAVTTLQFEATERASRCSEVQGEGVERRLQMKLDAALAASREDCQKRMEKCMSKYTATLSQRMESAKREVEAQQQARAAGIERRMQQLIALNATTTQTAMGAMETKIQDAALVTKKYRREFDTRLDKMKSELEQTFMSGCGITENQWEKITALIDEKLKENTRVTQGSKENNASTHRITSNCSQAASNIRDACTTSVGDLSVLQELAHAILATLRQMSECLAKYCECSPPLKES